MEKYHYIHASGMLSRDSSYQLHIIGPNKPPTCAELKAIMKFLEIDIEILSEAEGLPTDARSPTPTDTTPVPQTD